MTDKVLAYFVRHGTTSANESGLFRGESNPPLDEKGFRDAEAARDFLKGKEFGEILGSDKLRVQQTLRTVLENDPTLEPKLTKQLRAINVGYLTGLKKDEHQDDMKKFEQNPDLVIPRGESLNQFRQRVDPLIKFAIHRGIETGLPSLVGSHSSIIHQVGHLIHGDHTASLVKPGGIVEVRMTDKGLKAVPVFKPETKQHGYGS